jgi:hypothetical protein
MIDIKSILLGLFFGIALSAGITIMFNGFHWIH